MKNQVFSIFLFLLCVLFGASCTRDKNPLEPPEHKPNPRVLKGNAKLENQTDHYGILVYLEGLKLYTLTDEMGDYTLTIPDSLFSGDSLTVQGKFHIYYSFPYYDFDSTSVVTYRQGFVFSREDQDAEGHVTPVELNQVLGIKTVTDKAVYTPDDSLWVQVTWTNCSDRELNLLFYYEGMGYALRAVMLFDSSSFWEFSAPTSFAETEVKLTQRKSYMRSSRFPLASIREPRWGISFPWRCRVWAIGCCISHGLNEAPRALKGIVGRNGWFDIYSLNLPLGPFDLLMRDSFSLPEITIIDG